MKITKAELKQIIKEEVAMQRPILESGLGLMALAAAGYAVSKQNKEQAAKIVKELSDEEKQELASNIAKKAIEDLERLEMSKALQGYEDIPKDPEGADLEAEFRTKPTNLGWDPKAMGESKMKITKTELKRIIKEEIGKMMEILGPDSALHYDKQWDDIKQASGVDPPVSRAYSDDPCERYEYYFERVRKLPQPGDPSYYGDEYMDELTKAEIHWGQKCKAQKGTTGAPK